MDNFSLINKQKFVHPQLDCCFEDDVNYYYSVGLDNELKRINSELKYDVIGYHSTTFHRVIYDNEKKSVITAGWDNCIKLWDHRSENKLINSYNQNSKISTMCLSGNRLVVSCIEGNNIKNIKSFIKIYDKR